MNKRGLTKRQLKVLETIIEFMNDNNHCPSVSEISDVLDRSTPTIIGQLQALEDKGYISRKKNRTRAITVLEPPPNSEYVLVDKDLMKKILKKMERFGVHKSDNKRDVFLMANIENVLRDTY